MNLLGLICARGTNCNTSPSEATYGGFITSCRRTGVVINGDAGKGKVSVLCPKTIVGRLTLSVFYNNTIREALCPNEAS